MATSQADFDTALADFASYLNAALEKLTLPAEPVDLTDELNQLATLKAYLDAKLAPVPPAPVAQGDPVPEGA